MKTSTKILIILAFFALVAGTFCSCTSCSESGRRAHANTINSKIVSPKSGPVVLKPGSLSSSKMWAMYHAGTARMAYGGIVETVFVAKLSDFADSCIFTFDNHEAEYIFVEFKQH